MMPAALSISIYYDIGLQQNCSDGTEHRSLDFILFCLRPRPKVLRGYFLALYSEITPIGLGGNMGCWGSTAC